MPYTATYNSMSRFLRGCYNFTFIIIRNSQNWGFPEVSQTGVRLHFHPLFLCNTPFTTITDFSLSGPSSVSKVDQKGAVALSSFFNPYTCITFSIPQVSLYKPSTVKEVSQTGAAALLAG